MIVRSSQRTVEPGAHGIPKEVILRAGVLPNVTRMAVASLKQGAAVEPHVHPTMYEIYFILEGRAAHRLGATEIDAGPGDFLIVPPATPHSLRVTGGPFRIFYRGLAGEAGRDALNSSAQPVSAASE